MPTREHDVLVLLFQNRPCLAAERCRLVGGQPLPEFVDAVVEDPALPEEQVRTLH